MTIRDITPSYLRADAGLRSLCYTPAAEALASDLPGAVELGRVDHSAQPVLVVDLAARGGEPAAVAALGDVVGERGVAVLVLASPPAEMPVGAIVQAIGASNLRVVQAEGLASRHGRAVLVLTRDPDLPYRSYLLDQPVAMDDSAARRVTNEWAVCGLQMRAQLGNVEAQISGARDEAKALRVELDQRSAQWAAEKAKLAAQVAALSDVGVVARARRAKRAVGRIRKNPVQESRRLAVRVARRSKR